MNRVVHFELGAVDTARAVEFTRASLGGKRRIGAARWNIG